jgi:hypothetical protein
VRSPIRAALRASVLAGCLAGSVLGHAAPIGSGPRKPLAPGGIHVLFVGNSLTYTNDLPGTVASLGALAGDSIFVASATAPDLALIDHLNGQSSALAQIRQGGWQFVVLQQGPSSNSVSLDSLVLWTTMFDPYIRAVGAQPALFMVWPSRDRKASFDAVRQSYRLAAQAVHGVFMPAGAAWLKPWAADSALPLYGPDGFHPSPLGTYLAALVIYERLTGHDVRALPGRVVVDGQEIGLPRATVRLLQTAAHEANVENP